MSDVMRPIPFGDLMNWILMEYRKERTIFGEGKLIKHTDGKALPIFKEKIEAPFGPAAGPNTQLAQNLIAAYVTGARFFELKTVQKMDGRELAACVPKPCITAQDECYNCEWSTELEVGQAYEEYVKAWIACKVLARELELGDPEGFVFNMSVGYDLAGIQTEKVDGFLEGMKDASRSQVFVRSLQWLREHLDLFTKVDAAFIDSISPVISTSVTESTLHGCPPDEIERIATYLMTEKHLNTYIKCNPTLLGYEFARSRLDALGYDYITFDEHHFKEDLQWDDAVAMFRRLIRRSEETGLEFGVKLSNTFPVEVAAGELPSQEMYMSGRTLFTLTTEMARRITEEFNGKLRISYCGGADEHNIRALFDAGIWPVTMATTLLKPGGYERLFQIAMKFLDIEDNAFSGIDKKKMEVLARTAVEDPYYRKPVKPLPDRKIHTRVPLTDCFRAPCSDGCPIGQDIPAYLGAMAEGKPEEALQIIVSRNALPFITGTICPHTCQDKCMRNHYEASLHIREVKLAAAEAAFEKVLPLLRPQKEANAAEKNIAVIGAGPAGLSAAAFLSRAGVPVTVFERTSAAGGVVRHVIPEFRIGGEAIDKDLQLCLAYGARIRYGVEIQNPADLLKEGYTDVIVAIGAWDKGEAGLQYGEVLDALEFLEKAKNSPEKLQPGKNVIVIGGGNTAMDVARAARRLSGVEKVQLVYRRTRRYMPADEEELDLALKDGVEFLELLAPIGVKEGLLSCHVMQLGAPDASGRRSPVDTGEIREIPADTVIAAIGQRIDPALYQACGAELDGKGRPVVDENLQTTVPHIYAVGDGKSGPATVVKGMADAAVVAQALTGAGTAGKNAEYSEEDVRIRKARHGGLHPAETDAAREGARCLGCPEICTACAEVCPNRANVVLRVKGFAQPQILHMDAMCNECGNCAVFCPYESRPYRDKFTLFACREDFEASTNEGFLPETDGSFTVRLDDQIQKFHPETDAGTLRNDIEALIRTVKEDYGFLIHK